MIIKVKYNTESGVFDVSKLMSVTELKKKLKEKWSVDEEFQRLIFQGKVMSDENSLFDYRVNLNDVVQLWRREPLADRTNQDVSPVAEQVKEKEDQVAAVPEEEAESEVFKVGDIVDILDKDDGQGWFEGSVVRITRSESEKAGSDGLTYYVKYEAWAGEDYKVKLEQLRPRARTVLARSELKAGMEVLANYNVEEPGRRGWWVEGRVEKVTRQAVTCTLLVGPDQTPLHHCKLPFPDETMKLEPPVLLADRDPQLEAEMNTPVVRKNRPKCDVCLDNERKKCKECGCSKCGGKHDPDSLLICDQCQLHFHLKCVGLKTIPEEDDWYCPDCKNEDDIVKAGEAVKAGKKKAKMPSQKNEQKRDWGKGMATVGRTKVCSMHIHHFGPIPGIEVGTQWLHRMTISEDGIHRPPVAGIAGTAAVGCQSLVVSGGYEDDVDDGEQFTYTGSGGRDLSGNKRTAKQSFDQTLTKVNAAIAKNCHAKFDEKNGGDAGSDWKKGKEIRVVRGRGKEKVCPKFAPSEGYRYDGIYKVVKYWPEKGEAGFIVWRFLLRRDDPAPPPWTEEGLRRIEEGGWGELRVPENYYENLAEKLKMKAAALEDKEKSDKSRGNKRNCQEELETKSKRAKTVPVAKFKVPSEILKAMDKDTRNKRLWDEVRNKSYSTRKEFVDSVETESQCLVCLGIVTNPVTMPCSHSFCKTCIERAFKAEEYACAACRADLKGVKLEVNQEMRACLLLIFPGYEIL